MLYALEISAYPSVKMIIFYQLLRKFSNFNFMKIPKIFPIGKFRIKPPIGKFQKMTN